MNIQVIFLNRACACDLMSKVIFGPLPLASVGHGSSEENLPYTVHTILAGYMVL